jgi:hypothetical protein
MHRGLQCVIDSAPQFRFQAFLFVCGSCQHGLSGLRAKTVPLVIPRARNCISLLGAASAGPGLIRRSRPAHICRGSSKPQHHQARTRGDLGRPVFWMSPVHGTNSQLSDVRPASEEPRQRWHPPAIPSRATRFGPCSREAAKLLGSASWRAAFTEVPVTRPTPALLQSLADGYWSYDQFLVVPPGWQLVAREGTLRAEETTS